MPVKKNPTMEELMSFVELQYQQQLKSFYPIQKQENSFLWKIGEFPDVDFFANPWTSAIFEHGGGLW